jgi:hypothetical protein
MQFQTALAFKPLQKPFRLRKRQHPTNLFRQRLCDPLGVALMRVGEIGAAIQPLDPATGLPRAFLNGFKARRHFKQRRPS